jgi:AraC-like DNA-binding protein
MKVEKFFPAAALMPFVKEFIIIDSDAETGNRIIPDTAIVMAFRYRGRVAGGEAKEILPSGAISGLRRSARLIHYSKEAANLLVVLNELGITAFSRIPAHELFELSIPAENLFASSQLNEILERLAGADTNRSRIDLMEAFLLGRLIAGKQDPLIGHAIQLIRRQDGIIPIRDLSLSLHISQDAFEKRFRAQVGSTPKQYASIVRLRNLIKKYAASSSLTKVSYEAGYFDQSHFIKDFRLFTGQSPKDFFKSSRYW